MRAISPTDVWHNPGQIQHIIAEVEARVRVSQTYEALYDIESTHKFDRRIHVGTSVAKLGDRLRDPFLIGGVSALFENWETLVDRPDPTAEHTWAGLDVDSFAGALCLAARKTHLSARGAFNNVNLEAFEVTHPRQILAAYRQKSDYVWAGHFN